MLNATLAVPVSVVSVVLSCAAAVTGLARSVTGR